MQARGPLGESIHIMNVTIERRQIDLELWEVMLRDLIEHSRFYPVIAYLDGRHKSQWMSMHDGIDSVIRTISNMIQTYNTMNISVIGLNDESSVPIISVRDGLLLAERASPRTITIGSAPEVTVSDDVMNAACALNGLQTQLNEMQKIAPE